MAESQPVVLSQGTYYGYRTRGFGHCSFHFHGFGDSKGYVGTPLAINAAQYTGTSICGLCLKYRGLGQGAGGNPVSTGWQPGFICDQCPECKFGDIDQQMGGDGRWRVEWYPVQCPVGDSSFRFGFQNGNPWYRKVMVANARVPIADVQIWEDGKWKQLYKTIDNYWEYYGDASKMFGSCARIQVKSILGDTVQDNICCGYGTCTGKAQFPCRTEWPSDDCPSAQQPAKVNVGGIGLAPGSNSGNNAGTPASNVQTESKKGFRRDVDAAAARLPQNMLYLTKGMQCGGKGFECNKYGEGNCQDGQFSRVQCESGLVCKRNDDKWHADGSVGFVQMDVSLNPDDKDVRVLTFEDRHDCMKCLAVLRQWPGMDGAQLSMGAMPSAVVEQEIKDSYQQQLAMAGGDPAAVGASLPSGVVVFRRGKLPLRVGMDREEFTQVVVYQAAAQLALSNMGYQFDDA
eukprot:gene6889-7105_t